MIPVPFEYARAGSVDEAIQLLGSNEDAKILAGGHSLLPLMNVGSRRTMRRSTFGLRYVTPR